MTRLLASLGAAGVIAASVLVAIVVPADQAGAQTSCEATGSGTTWVINEPGPTGAFGGVAVGIPGARVTDINAANWPGRLSTNGLPQGTSLEFFANNTYPAGQAFKVNVTLDQPVTRGTFATYVINSGQTGYFPLTSCVIVLATTGSTTTTTVPTVPPVEEPPVVSSSSDIDWVWEGLTGLGVLLTASFVGIHTHGKDDDKDDGDDDDDGCDPFPWGDHGDDRPRLFGRLLAPTVDVPADGPGDKPAGTGPDRVPEDPTPVMSDDTPTNVEPPVLPPSEVFTPPAPKEPEYVSTGQTREKPGTHDDTAVGRDPMDNYRDFGGEPVWLRDSLQWTIGQGMLDRRIAEDPTISHQTIRVHYADDPWFIPDPTFVGMAPGDKYSKAFKQMYDSGQLGQEFKDALWALAEPESIVFILAVVGIQAIPGVNVVVDLAALVILLITFGEQLEDFLVLMGKIRTAINQQQFDHYTKQVAHILGGISSTLLVTFGLKAAQWAKGKVTSEPSTTKSSSTTSETTPSGKKPQFNTGGVHDALPEQPSGKKPQFNTGGVHDALPEAGQGEPMLPIKEHHPAGPEPVVKKLTPEEFEKWQRQVDNDWRRYEEWQKANPGRDPWSQPHDNWQPSGPQGTEKLGKVPNTVEPQGPTGTQKYEPGGAPQPKVGAPAGGGSAGATGGGQAMAPAQEPLLPVKGHHASGGGPVVEQMSPEEFHSWREQVDADWHRYQAWHLDNPGLDPFDQPPPDWQPPAH